MCIECVFCHNCADCMLVCASFSFLSLRSLFSSTVGVNVKLLPDGGASVLVCEAVLLEHCGLKLEGGCVS